MLPCARSCIGEKLKSLPAACASSPRIEPLLFLYPRWFRETAKSSCHVEARVRRYSTCPRPRSREVCSAGVCGQSRSFTETKQQDVPHPEDSFPSSCLRPLKRQPTKSVVTSNPISLPKSISRRPLGPRANKYHRHNVNVFALVGELTRHPPTAPSEFKTISLNSLFLHWLTGTSGENVWRHHDGSGCLVHVRSPLDPSDMEREVILSGTKRAMEIAHQSLKDLEAQYEHHQIPRPAADDTKKSKRLDSERRLRVDEIPRPDVWNLQSFCEYVEKVVTARKPRAIERELYPGDQSYNLTAARVLEEIFDNPHWYRFQSSFALRRALEFCSVRTEIANSAAIIWAGARKAGIIPDIACYNFEIRRNLTVKNEAGVKRLLQEMRITHTKPDPSTWACLFRALPTRSGQASFLKLPEVQPVLSNNAFRDDVLQGLVETIFEPSDSEPHCVAIFQEKMSKIFADGWLTPRVVQSMIEKCTQKRAFHTVSSVLRLASASQIKVDQRSSTALFKLVSDSKWFEDILLLLRISHPLKFDHPFNQERMETVFKEAWKQQLANTCRVIWHYAASHGYIRYAMLVGVARELTQNVHPSESSQVRPQARMAAVIVGVDQSLVTDTTITSKSKENQTHDVMSRLTRWTPAGEQRHKQMQLAHGLLERDLTIWQRCIPMQYETLLELLEQAFALDLRWLEDRVLSKASVHELVQRAIPVKLKVSDASGMPSNVGEHIANVKTTTGSKTSLHQGLEVSKLRSRNLPNGTEEMRHNNFDENLEKSQSASFQASA